MIIRYTYVLDIEVDDETSINDVAVVLDSQRRWPFPERVRGERSALEIIEKHGAPVAYAGPSVVGATND